MTMRLAPKFLSAAVLTALCLTGAAAQAARFDKALRETLVPHKALYAIEMIAKRSGSPVINIDGQMYFEVRDECEAWTTDHRFKLNYDYADSPPMQITSDFTTYEPFDGESFSFTSNRKRDGEVYQELRGTADYDEKDGGAVTFTQPADLTYKLPPGSFFPMGHTGALLKSIKDNKKIFTANVFDGSDEEGPIEISAVIGGAINAVAAMPANPAVDTTLVNSKAWRVRMAFFPMSSEDENADYEMDIVLHENGIISDMVVDYEDFSVSQKLIALERLDNERCRPAASRQKPKNVAPAPVGPLPQPFDKTVR